MNKTYPAFLFSLHSGGRRFWGIVKCPVPIKVFWKLDLTTKTYFEENVFFGATSIEAHMTLWSALSAWKWISLNIDWCFINFTSLQQKFKLLHSSPLTFIHLKEQYLAEHDGQVQVSCFCLQNLQCKYSIGSQFWEKGKLSGDILWMALNLMKFFLPFKFYHDFPRSVWKKNNKILVVSKL